MVKNLIIGALLAAVLALGYVLTLPKASAIPSAPTELCAQVVTPARDPATGTIVEYPTPCDVPDGWERIENDVPGLDLDLNLE